MRVIVTLNDIIGLGLGGILIVAGIIAFIVVLIDVQTREFRYKHFKCPNCSHMHPDGECGHFRNYKCNCNYFCRKRK